MATIEHGIEIEAPASVAYDTWTQFELFPQFMDSVETVEQKDDTHLHWRVNIWGATQDWEAKITEQIPDKRIAWTSESGASNAGCVTFHRLSDDRSRVLLQLDYEPEGLGETVADALGVFSQRVEADLKNFKAFVEEHGDRIEGWRGAVPARKDAAQRPG